MQGRLGGFGRRHRIRLRQSHADGTRSGEERVSGPRARPQGHRRVHCSSRRLHHRELHCYGDDASWWVGGNVDPLPVVFELWRRSRSSTTGHGFHAKQDTERVVPQEVALDPRTRWGLRTDRAWSLTRLFVGDRRGGYWQHKPSRARLRQMPGALRAKRTYRTAAGYPQVEL